MRLAVKLTVALVLLVVAGFGLQAFVSLSRIGSVHEHALRDDVLIAARALATGAGRIWELGGEGAAKQFVDDTDEKRERSRIALTAPDPSHVDSAPSAEAVESDGAVLSVSVPVFAHSVHVASIVLERRVAAERAELDDIARDHVGVMLGLTLGCVVVALWLGVALIGRPTEALVAHARRIASGDYGLTQATSRRDELGALAREMNLMAERLAAADEQVRGARRRAAAVQERLRHADRLSTLGRLASTIAHELGTPLNVVAGRAGLIVAAPSDEAKVTKNARVIVEQAKSMTHIIQQILDYARRRGLEKAPTKLGGVIEQAVSLLEPLAEERAVRLLEEGDMNLVACVDSQKTLQVLTNLMMNAIQAMPDGGTITLRVDAVDVAEPADARCAPGDYVRIDVEDQGVGMSAERMARIFEPFFTSKREGEGTGLGLSVCQGILREHGGFIEVDSEPGRGSRFSMFLPVEERS